MKNAIKLDSIIYSQTHLIAMNRKIYLLGYADEVTEIIKSLPRICQGFLMSATLSPELNSLKKIVLNSPVLLRLGNDEGNKDNDIGQ